VVGQNQSVCKRGLIRENIRHVATVENRLVMIKELAEVNQSKMDKDRELETVKFAHYQTQYHRYKLEATNKASKVDKVKNNKKLLKIHCRIHCQTAQ
jgi:hypothetical protein